MPRVVLQQASNTSDEGPKWCKIITFTSGVIGLYFSFSISLTFYQRWMFVNHILSKKKFDCPISVVAWHLLLKLMFATIFRWALHFITNRSNVSIDLSTSIFKLAPIGFAGGLDIALSNWGLELITVSLYTMTKSTTIIFILIFALVLRLERRGWSIFLIVFMISGGLAMFTYKSEQFNILGFVLVLLASLASGFRWTLAQVLMQQTDLGLQNPIDMIYCIQPWMILIIWPLALLFEGSSLLNLWNDNVLWNAVTLASIGAVVAFALELSEFLLIRTTSSLTMAVAGVCKDIITLVLAVVITGDQITPINIAGLVLCLGGVIGHITYKIQAVERKRDLVHLDEATALFLPYAVESEESEEVDEDDNSSSEILFNVIHGREWCS